MAAEYERLITASGGFGRYQMYLMAWFTTVVMVMAPQIGFMVYGSMHLKKTNDTGLKFYSVVDQFGLQGQAYKVTLLASIQQCGMMFGNMIGGQLSDTYGRRKAFIPLFIISSVVTEFSAFCNHYWLLVFARFVVGITTASVCAIILVITSELMPSKWRTIINTLSWPIGHMFGACLAKMSGHWQTYIHYTLIPVPVVLLMIALIQESPKILMEQGRMDDARRAFQQISIWNGGDTERVGQIFESMRDTPKLSPKSATVYTFRDLFYSRKMTKQLAALGFGWFVSEVSFYAMFMNISNLGGDAAKTVSYVMIWRSFIGLAVLFLDWRFTWFGRKVLYTMGLVMVMSCYVILIFSLSFSDNTGRTDTVILFSVLGTGSVTVIFTTVNVLVVEMIPTVLRNKGMGLMLSISRIGAMLGPQMLLLNDVSPAAPYLLLLPASLLNMCLVFGVLPETKGKPLPDMPVIYIYDNKLVA